jgi:hypothetical protein
MQPNTLTVGVDYLNDANVTNETYDRYSEFENRSIYVGANHSADSRDTITLYRTFPTKNGNFNGVQKSAIKLSKDHEVTGADGVATLTAPAIVEISTSFPVGMTEAEMLVCLMRAIGVQNLSDEVMDLVRKQMV